VDLSDNDDIATFKKYHVKIIELEKNLLTEREFKREHKPIDNDEHLHEAQKIETDNKNKLIAGLIQINETRDVAITIGNTLSSNRTKIENISTGLDGIESERQIASRLITNFVKRIYTDKVILSIFLLVILLSVLAGIFIAAKNKLIDIPSITP
jgi:hypothetical protein